MAKIATVVRWFTKVGKGQEQVHQRDSEGNLLFEEKETENPDGSKVISKIPKMGNEQYSAPQIPPGSFQGDQEENLGSALELSGNDHKVFFEAFRLGWNELEQQKAAGMDLYSRTFRTLKKLGYSDEEAQASVNALKSGRGN